MPAKKNLHKDASNILFDFARQNRAIQTDAENLLWQCLRDRKIKGQKFRRQHVFGEFILDFYCHYGKLAIEVVGSIHQNENVKANDARKNKYLKSLGIEILRFTNEAVISKTEWVVIEKERKIPDKYSWRSKDK